jgi:hypothetical protein
MAYVIADRTKQQTTTTGTGPVTLGSSVTGFQVFSAVCSNADTFHYAIVHLTNGSWETGLGTYNSGAGTVSRSVLTSSDNNALIDFAAGAKEIFISPVAYNIVLKNNTGAITPGVVKTVTLDFGNVPVNSQSFSIADSSATTASVITISPSASTANSAYGGDELEMDNFSVSAYCAVNGTIIIQAVPKPSPVWGQRNFNYIVGSGV